MKENKIAEKKECIRKNCEKKTSSSSCSSSRKSISLHALAIALLFLGFLMCSISAVYAVADLMALQGNAANDGTPMSNSNLLVTVYDSPTGGNLIYNSTADYNGVINNGRFDIVLGDGANELVLEYGKKYYMDMSINGIDLDFNGSERKVFQSGIGNITAPYLATDAVTSIKISDGTIVDADISASANINKSKISSSGAWLESDIPSLTNGWPGTLNASRIVSQYLLNVNSSSYSSFLSGYSSAQFFSNDTSLDMRIGSLNSTKAGVGSCPSGQYVVNTTISGVECMAIAVEANGASGWKNTSTNTYTALDVNTTGNMKAATINATTGFYGNLNASYVQNPPWITTGGGNNYTTNMLISNETTHTVTTSRTGMADLTTTFLDYNNYTTGASFAGAVLTLTINGGQNVQATIPDNSIKLDYTNITSPPWLISYTESDPIFTATNTSIWGNISAKYDTTNPLSFMNGSYGNSTYYLASNALGFINTTYGNATYYLATNPNGYVNALTDAAGWFNSSVSTRTDLNVRVSTGNLTVSAGRLSVGTDELTYTLNVNGNANVNGPITAINVTADNYFGNINASYIQNPPWQTTPGIAGEWSRKYYSREIGFESVTAGYTEPWAPAALSSGTATLGVGLVNHPGIARISTSTTINSGYNFQITGTSTYLLGPDYVSTLSFRPFVLTNNFTYMRAGFMDSFTTILPTDGVYCQVNQTNQTGTVVLTAIGVASNNSVKTNTATNYNLTNNTWYTCEVYIVNATLANFTIYNETTQVWRDSVTASIPTATGRETSHAVVAYVMGNSTTARPLVDVDFMSVAINNQLTR